jgi:hypothetical protein
VVVVVVVVVVVMLLPWIFIAICNCGVLASTQGHLHKLH